MIKRINYTQLQEEHLIEMCKKLFPEYGKVHISGAWLYFDKGMIPLDTIPIFEFCMTYLVNKLYYPDNCGKRDTRRKVENFFFQSFVDSIEGESAGYDHPIDYLYDEFNKLIWKNN